MVTIMYKDPIKFKYKPRKKGYSPYKKGMNIWLKLLIFFAAFALLGLCIVYFVLPNVLPHFGIEYAAPGISTPTPIPTVEPTPTPNPLKALDLTAESNEVVVSTSACTWYGDPYFYDGKLIFTGGQLVSGNAMMNTLLMYEPESRSTTRLTVALENDHFFYPVMNEDWLVFLDASAEGGGIIKCYDRKNDTTFSNPIEVKTVYTGQPALFLSGDNLSWIERTGTSMDKLFVCNLRGIESVTVQMFERSIYGVSKPHLSNGLLIWADTVSEAADGSIISQICSVNLDTGKYNAPYYPDSYVHDPKSNGSTEYIAWLDGNHGPLTNLYISHKLGEKKLVANEVVDFFCDEKFLAYQKGNSVFVYVYSDDMTLCITSNSVLAQLLSVSDGKVVWMDVTSRERDVLKFTDIPL